MSGCPKCQSAGFLMQSGLAKCANGHMWREANTHKRANKHNAKTVLIDGMLFRSGWEGRRYLQLKTLERAGEIKDLFLQINVKLTKYISWRVDFRYIDRHGVLVHEDSKGFETEPFNLKQKLWAEFGPTPLLLSHERKGIYRVVTPGQPVPKTKRKTKKGKS